MRIFLTVIFLMLLGYAIGFLLFVGNLPVAPSVMPRADGIVTLTGGGERLDTAVALLERKGAQVKLVDATSCPDLRNEMVTRSGRWTFPQIFIGDTHIGGCDDLHALEQRGGLDPLLMGQNA